jgi:MFS family permease
MVQTACYAIISHVFSEEREKYIGYAEAVTGIGLMMGPVIGGPLYQTLGYFWSFNVFAAIMAVSLIVSLVITPSILNKGVPENTNQVKDKKASFKVFLLNKRAMFSLVSCGIVCFFMSY